MYIINSISIHDGTFTYLNREKCSYMRHAGNSKWKPKSMRDLRLKIQLNISNVSNSVWTSGCTVIELDFKASRAIKLMIKSFTHFLPSKILHIFFIKYIISFNDRKTVSFSYNVFPVGEQSLGAAYADKRK